MTTATYTPGSAVLSRSAPAKACTTKRAADGNPGVWSLPIRSLSIVLGMCTAASAWPALRASSTTMRTVSDESLPPM